MNIIKIFTKTKFLIIKSLIFCNAFEVMQDIVATESSLTVVPASACIASERKKSRRRCRPSLRLHRICVKTVV